MSAVLESATPESRALPLVKHAEGGRIFAWHGARAVDVTGFLADVATVAAELPAARAAINLCEDRYAFLVAFCAIACRGQTNLLPPSRASQAVEETLAAYPGSYALGEAELTPAPARSLCMPPLPAARGGAVAVPALAADAVVAIGFTSGSTGQPKPNPKSWQAFHASTQRNVAALTDVLNLAPGAIAHVVATVPPQHMYGIELSVLLPLLGPFAVHGGRPLFPADVAAALAEVPEPRVLVTTPVHLRALLSDPTPLPTLGVITSATAPLPPELAAQAEARYGATVLEMFGSTETCVIAQRRSAHEPDWRLYPGVTLRPQPDGTVVEAPYFSQPVILQDVVEVLPGHRFRLRGRNADLVEIAGKRASLADLTRRVLALPGVHDAVVLQLDEADSMGVRRIAALVVAPERSEAELLNGLREAIDPAFLPRPLRRLDALPRNETGKLPRAALLAALGSESGT
ncbi:AMP-binding protein [Dokdonella soli]|uniref:Xanthomonadin biosynthesis 3-hydroxybenozate--AMP ligase XanA2 n=1 Tax=Dokdonella soli TaxID=529810 RepID=A0ABP3TQ33_9GAMM